MEQSVAIVITMGFALALAAIGCAYGMGKAVVSALEGTARQPEAAGAIRVSMIIGLALIEALAIYVLVISFLLFGQLGAAAA